MTDREAAATSRSARRSSAITHGGSPLMPSHSQGAERRAERRTQHVATVARCAPAVGELLQAAAQPPESAGALQRTSAAPPRTSGATVGDRALPAPSAAATRTMTEPPAGTPPEAPARVPGSPAGPGRPAGAGEPPPGHPRR
ncbi:hypothetical protein AB0G04_14290 [Actinoplanes sp. NPDC023801]|uniref:hypothetical protein n=1 Tax=Actinoplanes sp. NPDC023801 TaxID=3154595 RepID=UPI0033EA300A